MLKKSLMMFLIIVLMFSLSGCIKIKVKDAEIGEDAGVDEDWDDLEERFDILKYVPELADEVDYYCVNEGNTTDEEGVDIGFKEVRKPKKKADEMMKILERAGFEYVGDRCYTNWGRTPEGQIEDDDYHCFNYSLDVNEDDYSRVAVFIEYFDDKYPNNHNLFFKITPEKNNAKPKEKSDK